MALITCPECGHQVSDKAVACPGCGYPVSVMLSQNTQKTDCGADGQILPTEASNEGKKDGEVEEAASRKRPRHKKYKKLPNGFGTIRKLSGNRRNPYAAYPPVTEYHLNGSPVKRSAIGYFPSWHEAYKALLEYHKQTQQPAEPEKRSLTFAEVFALFYKSKFEDSKKVLSKSTQRFYKTAFNNCSALHDAPMREIRQVEMQAVLDGCQNKRSSHKQINTLFNQMFEFAMANDYVDRDYSDYVSISVPEDNEPGVPFYEEELLCLWNSKGDPTVDLILFMCYSGFRISELETLEINLEDCWVRGGMKTEAGRDRTVPIHPAVYDFAVAFSKVKKFRGDYFRVRKFYPTLERLGLKDSVEGPKHTPHDTRHTFSWLCDEGCGKGNSVERLSKHLMMGHSLQKYGVEDSVYGHRTLNDLRREIEKIQVPPFV